MIAAVTAAAAEVATATGVVDLVDAAAALLRDDVPSCSFTTPSLLFLLLRAAPELV